MTRETKETVAKLVEQDKDLLQQMVQAAVQQILEAEMTDALGAGKSQRTAGRRGYRSGYYERSLVTRVGKLELRVPQDREGRFSTELFERYSARSERFRPLILAPPDHLFWRRPTTRSASPRPAPVLTDIQGKLATLGACGAPGHRLRSYAVG